MSEGRMPSAEAMSLANNFSQFGVNAYRQAALATNDSFVISPTLFIFTLMALYPKTGGSSRVQLQNAIHMEESLRRDDEKADRLSQELQPLVTCIKAASSDAGAASCYETSRIYLDDAFPYKPFDAKLTKKGAFTLMDGKTTVQADMMSRAQDGQYKYLETPEFQYAELPYRSTEFVAFVILPKAQSNVKQIENNISFEYLADLHARAQMTNLAVSIPKFRINYSLNGKNVLNKLGITDLFTPKANLTLMSDKLGLSLSDAYTVTFLSVDETGTEVAAASSAGVRAAGIPMGGPKAIAFTANRPFVFGILRDNALNRTLVLGRVVDPAKVDTVYKTV